MQAEQRVPHSCWLPEMSAQVLLLKRTMLAGQDWQVERRELLGQERQPFSQVTQVLLVDRK